MLRAEAKEELLQKEAVGLEDGGHIILTCPNCKKNLVNIWRTRPNEKLAAKAIIWKVRAKCCYCNDMTYIKEITGGFHHAGWGDAVSNDPEMDIPRTVVDRIEPEEDVYIFYTSKVNNG